jgi:hypothetical protein
MKLVATERNRSMSSVTSSDKMKKTKSEKICELQAEMKLMKVRPFDARCSALKLNEDYHLQLNTLP